MSRLRPEWFLLFLVTFLGSGCFSEDMPLIVDEVIPTIGDFPGFRIVEVAEQIDVFVDGQLFTSYRYGEGLTKPCLYPLYTATGVSVVRDYPFRSLARGSRDHPHHTGVFFSYGDVNGLDFWGSLESPPKVDHIRVLDIEEGKDSGKLTLLKHWIDAEQRVLLEERQQMVFRKEAGARAINFSITLTAPDRAVSFGDTKEGMFAIRVADWLAEERNNSFYTSSTGERREFEVWGTRAAWMMLQGSSQGRAAGLALLHHPSSTNFPTYWHARAYGLFAANPLGQAAFQEEKDIRPVTPYSLRLAPGDSAIFAFKLLVYDGLKSKSEMDHLFSEYR